MGLVVGVKIGLAALWSGIDAPLWTVAVAACAPVLVGSPRRWALTAGIDWHTLVFFAVLFVLVQAVWDTDVVQTWLPAGTDWATEPSLILTPDAVARTRTVRWPGNAEMIGQPFL
jgi:hypothetical protein